MSNQRYTLAVQMIPIGGANPLVGKISTTTLVAGAPGGFSIKASGGVGPYSYSLTSGALPTGMGALGATTGIAAGTLTAAGTFTGVIQITDSTPGTPLTTSVRFTVTVAVFLSWTQGVPATATGAAYSFQLQINGATGTVTYTTGTPTHGLTLTTGGLISGTVTSFGSASFTTTATDSGTGASITFTVQISIGAYPTTITPGVSVNVTVGNSVSSTQTIHGGCGPYTVTSNSSFGDVVVTMLQKGSGISGAALTPQFKFVFTPVGINYPSPLNVGNLSFQIVDGLGNSHAVTVGYGVTNNSPPLIVQNNGTTVGVAPISGINFANPSSLSVASGVATITLPGGGATSAPFGTASGTNTYTVTLGLSSLVAKQQAEVQFTNANTSTTVTLNSDSLGAVTMLVNGAVPAIGFISAGSIYPVEYDGTNWNIVGETNIDSTGAIIVLNQGNTTPAAAPTGKVKLAANSVGGRNMFGACDENGVFVPFQPHLAKTQILRCNPTPASATWTTDGCPAPATTLSTVNPNTPNGGGTYLTKRAFTSVTASSSAAGTVQILTISPTQCIVGTGFHAIFHISWSDGVSAARAFTGFSNTLPTNVDPSAFVNAIGLGQLAGDSTQLYICYGGTTAQTPIALGTNFPPTANAVYELSLWNVPGDTTHVFYQVRRLDVAQVTNGTLTAAVAGTQLPGSIALPIRLSRTNNATATQTNINVLGIYVEVPY